MTDAAAKLLQQNFKKLMTDPVEGFAAEIPDDSNLYNWRIYLEGPKDTIYEGGIFQLSMTFPKDYPMSPPELRFISDFWHPNVFPDGKVCISILHPPGEDELSGERPEERWLPTQSVATIMLSVISMLSDPNFSSPANVDASVQWRKDMDGFKRKVKELIKKASAEFDGHIKIPHPDTNEEERSKAIERIKELNKPMDLYDEFDEYAEEDFEDGDDFEDGEDFEDGDEDEEEEEDGDEDD